SGSGLRCQDTILGDIPAQTKFERLSKQSHEPPLSRVNTLGSGEDIMKQIELMKLCTKLSDMVLDLESVKDAQALEINKLKKRVKKLESKKKSRTLQLKRRLFKVKIKSSSDKNLVTTAGVSVSTAEPSNPPTTTTLIKDEDLIIAQTLMKMRSVKSKEKSKEKGVSSTRLTRGVIMNEAKVVEGSSHAKGSKKRTRKELDEASVKRQKLEGDAEKAELKLCLKIVLKDDEAINIESLATKYPIVNWKTHVLDEKKIQDVLDLYRLVKERFETTNPEGYDRLLWGYLITLFEPSEEDKV
nr:hypothetical protein [Tanacetum cinerariifolium]